MVYSFAPARGFSNRGFSNRGEVWRLRARMQDDDDDNEHHAPPRPVTSSGDRAESGLAEISEPSTEVEGDLDFEDCAAVTPLLIRQGSRYRCYGDGLCCSDVHAIGSLEPHEVEKLEMIQPEVVGYSELIEAHVLRMKPDGTCPFLGSAGCVLHEPMGGELKPHPCKRFPYGLTATPHGGRVTTEHRCPCRTMGHDRPPITPDSAAAELLEANEPDGSLRANHAVDDSIPLSATEVVDFDGYIAIEEPLLEQLLQAGDGAPSPEQLLGFEPFPALNEGDWRSIARGMHAVEIDSRFDMALDWFGSAIEAHYGQPLKDHPRPWSDSFDRAEQRSEPGDPELMLRDWVGDSIWCLYWTAYGTFTQTRAELATRIAIARRLAAHFLERGARADRAMAEAITIVDLVGTSDWWEGVTHRIAEPDLVGERLSRSRA